MELMEEGNLMDRVQILLQRDLAYYEEHQTVLQENLCLDVVGGPFDFPRYASFAAVKLVQWWEEEFVACFHHASGLIEGTQNSEVSEKSLPASEFVSLVQQSAEKLLDHLHTLSQESLDHADLTVLTATLGAAALTKNALHCFNETIKKETKGLSVHQTSRLMQEMVEALAERLLDLHCRLMALYVLQDADSLHWESQHAFFEGQRGSFTIQMWWFYMQGAREDLWNTVPPKTAQRVLAGMLNESLTILTARYTQARPSLARSSQLVADIGNILVCVRHLLPSICNSGNEFVGIVGPGSSKASRDIHAKCHDLLCTLLCRGCPLATLYKLFRKGLSPDMNVLSPAKSDSPSPWLVLLAPSLLPLSAGTAVAVEVVVLVAQPEACWPQLLRVLLMRESLATSLLLKHLLHVDTKDATPKRTDTGCGGFLCGPTAGCWVEGSKLEPHEVLCSLVVCVVTLCGETEGGGSKGLATALAPLLHQQLDWSCMDTRQVWAEQRRPAWLTALVTLAKETIGTLANWPLNIESLLDGLAQLADTLPAGLIMVTKLLDDILPADVNPFGGSSLMQVLGAATYSLLIEQKLDSSTKLAEHWCNHNSHKYTEQVTRITVAASTLLKGHEDCIADDSCVEDVSQVAEVLASSLLLSAAGRTALKVVYRFVQHHAGWLLGELGTLSSHISAPVVVLPGRPDPPLLLHAMFHVGSHTFDELLSGAWQLDWWSLLHTNLGLTHQMMREQLMKRAEFREPHFLNQHDAKVVETLANVFNLVNQAS